MKGNVMVETIDIQEVFEELINDNEVMFVRNGNQYPVIGVAPRGKDIDLIVNKDRETVTMTFDVYNDDYFLYITMKGI